MATKKNGVSSKTVEGLKALKDLAMKIAKKGSQRFSVNVDLSGLLKFNFKVKINKRFLFILVGLYMLSAFPQLIPLIQALL